MLFIVVCPIGLWLKKKIEAIYLEDPNSRVKE